MVTVKISLIILFLIPVAMAATRKLDMPTGRKPALVKDNAVLKGEVPSSEIKTSQNRVEQISAKRSRQNQEDRRK